MGVNGPGEAEERDGDQDGADVGQREAEFGLRGIIVAGGEGVEDGVDAGDNEGKGDEEADPGPEIHEADLGGGEAVPVAAVDGLEVGVEGVVCAEDGGLINGHDEHDRLGEEDAERAFHARTQFSAERARVFVDDAVAARGALFFERGFPALEDHGRVGFFEEAEAD